MNYGHCQTVMSDSLDYDEIISIFNPEPRRTFWCKLAASPPQATHGKIKRFMPVVAVE